MIGFARSSFDQINAWKLVRFNAGTRVALVGGSFSLRVCFVLNIIQRKAASVVIFLLFWYTLQMNLSSSFTSSSSRFSNEPNLAKTSSV